MKLRMPAPLALAVIAAGPLLAHHNMRAVYNLNQRFTQTGTLTQVDWRFPHINLSVDVKNDQGQVQKWLLEGPDPTFFRGRNVTRSDFDSSVNKTVIVEASPARNNSRSALIREITLADGKVVSACPQNC